MASDLGSLKVGPIARKLLFVALLGFVIASAVGDSTPMDFWWHLATGRWISEHAKVPLAEPFSWASTKTTWVAYSWLFEWGIYWLYLHLGDATQILFLGTFAILIVYNLDAWIEEAGGGGASIYGAALLVLVTGALFNLLAARTWLFSILFLVLELRLLQRERRWWWIPALFVLWANLHIQFVVGLGVLGLAILAERYAGKFPRRLMAVLGVAVLATLLNPYGYRVYGVVWEILREHAPALVVQETKPADFRLMGAWAAFVLALWAAYQFGRGRRRLDEAGFAGLLFIVGNILALRMARDVWVGALGSAALLLANPPRPEMADGAARSSVPFKRVAALVAMAGLAISTGVSGWHVGATRAQLESSLPTRAAAFLAGSGLPGPLFNSFNWGGYVTWALPAYPVSLDGRTNQYSTEKILRDVSTWAGEPGWKSNPDLARSQLVLTPRDAGLFSVLELDPAFREIYADEVAAVFQRRPKAN